MGTHHDQDIESLRREISWQTEVDMLNRDTTTSIIWILGMVIGWILVGVFRLFGLAFRKATAPPPRTDRNALASQPHETSDEEQRQAIAYFSRR